MQKKGKKGCKKCKFFLLALFGMIFLFQAKAYALNDDGVKRVLESFPEFFTTNNLIRDTGRTIAWAVVKGLTWLAEQCTSLYQFALGFVDFTNYSAVTEYVTSLRGIFVAILAISILGLGIVLIIDHEKKPKILKSLFLMGITISASSYLLTTLSQAVKEDAMDIAGNNIVVADVVNSSVYDLLYIDKHCGGLANMQEDDLNSYHYAGGYLDVDKIDITEVINPNSDLITTNDAKDILSQKVLYTYNGSQTYEAVLQDIYNGFGFNSGDEDDWFNEFYYRYKVDYFYIYLSLLAVIIVYICMSYKVIRIVFEIVTGRILGLLYSANINGTQKTIKILESILNGYIVLLLTAVLIKLFTFAQQFLNNNVPYDQHPVANCLLLLFLAFSVVDGPNIIQQITGIDAGLSSGVGKIIAGYHMASGAARTLSGAVGMGNQIVYQNNMKKQQERQNEILQSMANASGESNSENGRNVPPEMSGSGNSSTMNQENNSSNQRNATNSENASHINNAASQNNGQTSLNNGSQGNDNARHSDPMSQRDLDGTPMEHGREENPSEMVDLSNNKENMSDMAERMNQDLNAMYDEKAMDMNGSSGLGIQNPVTVKDEWGELFGPESNDHPTSKKQNQEKYNFTDVTIGKK